MPTLSQSESDEYKNGYNVSTCEIRHGKVRIQVKEVKSPSEALQHEFYCRAWFNVLRNGGKIFSIYYPDMEPVGGPYGLFIPQNQPPSPYFAIVKQGDYDGRLFLVNKSGDVHNLKGGSYFVTRDKRYLFSEYVSDMSGLEVFDLRKGKTVFTSDEDFPEILRWYENKGEYFFIELAPSKSEECEAYWIDFAKGQITKKRVNAAALSRAREVKFDFDAKLYADCSCSDGRG